MELFYDRYFENNRWKHFKFSLEMSLVIIQYHANFESVLGKAFLRKNFIGKQKQNSL